jgi:hypothetical protein
MLYSTWQIMVKKKMQKPVKIFLRAFADRSISLPVLLGSYHFAPEPVNDFRGLEMGAMNTAESAFSMRRTQKTVAASGDAGNWMLYSIWSRPHEGYSFTFRDFGFTRRPEYAI